MKPFLCEPKKKSRQSDQNIVLRSIFCGSDSFFFSDYIVDESDSTIIISFCVFSGEIRPFRFEAINLTRT